MNATYQNVCTLYNVHVFRVCLTLNELQAYGGLFMYICNPGRYNIHITQQLELWQLEQYSTYYLSNVVGSVGVQAYVSI